MKQNPSAPVEAKKTSFGLTYNRLDPRPHLPGPLRSHQLLIGLGFESAPPTLQEQVFLHL